MRQWARDFIAHAREALPNEACGFLVDGQYRRARNIHEHPRNAFRAHPADQPEVFEGVCHSHPTGPARLTDADLEMQRRVPVPWHLFNVPTEELLSFDPKDAPLPYKGRTFHFGITDCFALARDWYARERGIVLPDFPREDGFEDRGESPFEEHYEECGFVPVASPEHGDLILFMLGHPTPKVPNHVGIYLEGDRILHHRRHCLSGEEPYGAHYRKMTCRILRFGGRNGADTGIPAR